MMPNLSDHSASRLEVWRQIYLSEGRRWDNLPSLTAHMALGDIFRKVQTASLLDVGCGYGRDLLFFSHFSSNLYLSGIDLVPEAIKMGASVIPDVSFRSEDFLSMKLADYKASQDVVYSNYFLHLLSAPEVVEALRRMRSCLRESGIIVSSFVSIEDQHFGCGSRSLDDERVYEVLPSIQWRFYDRHEVQNVAKQVNLKVQRCAPYREVELVGGEIDPVSGLYVVLRK